MKLIGQNSISKYLSHFFFIGFLGFLFYLLYFLFGFFICYLNYKEGFEIFSNTFFVEKKIFTSGIFDFFTINFPFTKTPLIEAVDNIRSFLGITIGLIYFIIFFYSSYRIMKFLVNDKIFTINIIKWTKIFTINNLIFLILFVVLWYFTWKIITLVELILYIFTISFFIIVSLFVIEFLKKGNLIQSENDLTI